MKVNLDKFAQDHMREFFFVLILLRPSLALENISDPLWSTNTQSHLLESSKCIGHNSRLFRLIKSPKKCLESEMPLLSFLKSSFRPVTGISINNQYLVLYNIFIIGLLFVIDVDTMTMLNLLSFSPQ